MDDLSQLRKRVVELEDALQESQRRLSTLVGNLPGMAYRCRNDPNWTMEFVSEGCVELTGYSATDLIDSGTIAYGSLIHPDERDQVWHDVQTALQNDNHFEITYRITTRTGQEKWVWEKGHGVKSSEGELSAIEGFIADITTLKRMEEAGRQREVTFQLLFKNTSDLICLHDPDGTFQYLSPSCEQLLGYRPEELFGTDPYALFHPDDMMRIRTESHDHVLEGETIDKIVYRIRKKSGDYIWFETITQPVMDGHQNVIALVSSSRDVTKRRSLIQRLQVLHSIDKAILRADTPQAVARDAMEQLKDLIPSKRARVVEFDSEADSFVVLYDRANPEREGQRFSLDSLLYPSILEERDPIWIEDTATDEQSTRVEPFAHDADLRSHIRVPLIVQGKLIGALALGAENPDTLGREQFAIAIEVGAQLAIAIQQTRLHQQVEAHVDDLERRVSERTVQLQKAKNYVETILNSSGNAIILMNKTGRISQTNPAFSELFGFKNDEVVEQSIDFLIGPEHMDGILDKISSLGVEHQGRQLEFIARRKDKTTFHAEMVAAPIGNSTGSDVVCVVHDVSEHKLLAESLHQALETEKNLNELKSRFVSMVSHEFKTPLTVINSTAETLQRHFDRLSQEMKFERLQRIRGQVKHLTALLNDTLDITRADTVGLDFDPAPTDLKAFCRELVEDIKATAEGVQIEYSHTGECGEAIADKNLARRIVTNLLSNAVKYSLPQGKVRFELVCEEQQATMRIKDDGIGIPKEDQERLFESFHRAGNVGAISGSGLGLVIVQRAIEAHGGTISFESEEDAGTTFTVTIPTGNHAARQDNLDH